MEVRKGQEPRLCLPGDSALERWVGFGWRLRPDSARYWHRISASTKTKKRGQMSRVTISVQLQDDPVFFFLGFSLP